MGRVDSPLRPARPVSCRGWIVPRAVRFESGNRTYRQSMSCVVVLPTYNEAETVTATLERLVALDPLGPHGDVHVLVVDDDSPDGTADRVRAHPSYGDRIQLLSRDTKDGLGAAYRCGLAHALADGYETVVQMDTDGSHPVDQIPAMVGLLEVHDLVVGSRHVAGGRTENWPYRRRLLSSAANQCARRTLRLRTKDTTSGFRAWRAPALVRINAVTTTSRGYGFQVENTWRTERAGLRVAKHPIVFTDRSLGASKTTLDVATEAARLVLTWRLGVLRHDRPVATSVHGSPARSATQRR